MEVLTESSLVLWSLQEGHEAASNQAMCTDLIGESGTILNIFPLMLQQGASSGCSRDKFGFKLVFPVFKCIFCPCKPASWHIEMPLPSANALFIFLS